MHSICKVSLPTTNHSLKPLKGSVLVYICKPSCFNDRRLESRKENGLVFMRCMLRLFSDKAVILAALRGGDSGRRALENTGGLRLLL